MSNLSEEEKKIVAYLRFYLNDTENEYFDKDFIISKKDLTVILNLIERQQDVKQTSDEFTNETRYYTPEGEIYKTIIETYKCPKNYISKDKIRGKIKELEEKIHVVTPDTHIIEKITEFKNEGALNILQELLEERSK